jgi:hypothetical protein
MIGTLCILGAIVFRSYNQSAKKPPAEDSEVEQARTDDKKPDSASSAKVPAPLKPAEKVIADAAATDEDSEEQAAAQEEFQALTDGTLGIGKEEMFAYRRVFDWVTRQSFDEMKKRAKKNVSFDGLMRTPDQFRGKLVQIDLNVRQVIRYDENPLDSKNLYELWGFTADSRAWLYCVITPELPEGVPVGTNVVAQVRVEGYFFKLQGYRPGSAKPKDAPLKAPLLIGRVKQFGTPGDRAATVDNTWLYYAACGFLLLSMFFTLGCIIFQRRARRHQAKLDACKIERSGPWLSRGELPESEKSPHRDEDEDTAEEGF